MSTPRNKPEPEHAEQGHERDGKLGATKPPDPLQRVDVDQPSYRHEHDGREHRLREVAEQVGQEHDHEQHDERGNESRERACARRRFRSPATATCRR